MKKFFICFFVFTMMLSILGSSVLYAKTDAAKVLQELDVLRGTPSGDLLLDNELKRQDMVVLLSRLYKEENKAKNFLVTPQFKDINADNSFYHGYIQWAVDKGLVLGMEDGNFGIGRTVKVQDFQVLILRVLGYTEEAKLYSSVPDIAKRLGLMEGVEATYNDNLIRRDMAQITLNALEMSKKGSALTLAEFLSVEITLERIGQRDNLQGY